MAHSAVNSASRALSLEDGTMAKWHIRNAANYLGHWKLKALLAGLALGTLPLVACSSNASGPQTGAEVLQSLKLNAEVLDLGGSPPTYEIRTVLTNAGARSIRFQTFRDCSVRLRAYETSARSGEPAWDESADSGCSYVAMTVTLEPEESRTFVRQLTAAEIALAPGTYYLSATLVVEDSAKVVDAGTIVLK
jgi:hypothetical protein